MAELLGRINGIIWGLPALVLIVGVGIYLTVKTRFVQVRMLPCALVMFCKQFTGKGTSRDGVSPYQALCTALAATVGTGNIVGVAGALAIGGPGAIFWMWCCGFLGMAIKFAEATLAVRYRIQNSAGEWVGGPMYMIRQGMGKRWHWLAGVYAFFGVVAAFGVGNATQINAVIGGINSALLAMGGNPTFAGNLLMGIVLAVIIASILLGGARRIGEIAERLVPLTSVLYLLLCIGVLVVCYRQIPIALQSIIEGAFSPEAVTGGVIGSALVALRVGASRGVFTNEAGMGTAAIAHASANVKNPVEQGMMGIVEVFLDTLVMCSLTAFAILCSGVTIPFGEDIGSALTTEAFVSVYGDWISVVLALCLCFFALATVLGWGLYGVRCAQYLFGAKVWKKFVYLQCVTVMIGAVLQTQTVWQISEIVNGLMVIPCLIALAHLTPELVKLTENFRKKKSTLGADGGTYENINQCKPMRAFTYAEISSVGIGCREAGKEDLSPEYRTARP